MMNVLVTGANGFLGRQVVHVLAGSYNVYMLDREESRTDAGQPVRCDITNYDDILSSLESAHIDYVVHCAALAHFRGRRYSEDEIYRVNMIGTENLVRYFGSRGTVRLFVMISTVAVYGEHGYNGPVAEDDPVRPVSAYARSKAAAENACLRAGNLPVTILRLTPLYSADEPRNIQKRVSPAGRRLRVMVGDGKQRYSFCARDNAADSIAWVIHNASRVQNTVLNVADPVDYSWLELAAALQPFTGRTWTIRLPRALVRTVASFGRCVAGKRGGSVWSAYWKLAEDNLYSSSRIQQMGFTPRLTLSDVFGKCECLQDRPSGVLGKPK